MAETIRPTDWYGAVASTNFTPYGVANCYDTDQNSYTGVSVQGGNPGYCQFGGAGGYGGSNANAWQSKALTWVSATLYVKYERPTGDVNVPYSLALYTASGTLIATIVAQTTSAVALQTFSVTLNSADWGGSGFPNIANARVRVTDHSAFSSSYPPNVYDVRIEAVTVNVYECSSTFGASAAQSLGSQSNYQGSSSFGSSAGVSDVGGVSVDGALSVDTGGGFSGDAVSLLTRQDNDPLLEYATRIIVEFPGLAKKMISSEDTYISDQLYERRLLNEPDISKDADNIYWGISKARDLSVRLSNTDGYFSGRDLRNEPVIIRRYEPLDSTPIVFELYGLVVDANILDEVEVSVSVQDQLALQPKLPRKVLTNDDFAAARPTASFRPAKDLGRALPIGFGHSKKVEAVYVYGDTTANTYDYIIGAGVIESTNLNKATTVNVYRGKSLVAGTEYTVYDGSDGTYTDERGVKYAWIRFTSEQRDFSGSLYDIHVDYHGLELGGITAERNPARQVQYILSDTLWGLGLTVDTASFDSVVAALPALLTDPVLREQREAQYTINDLLAIARAKIEKNESGAWIIRADVWKSTVIASFGSGDQFTENIFEITENRMTSARDAVKNITVKYGWNEWTGAYAYTLKRDVLSIGEEKIVELPFVVDSETADRHICYLQRSCTTCDKRVGVKLAMEARKIRDYDPISISVPRLSVGGLYQVISLTRGMTSFTLGCRNYSPNLYDYVAGTLPSAAGSDDLPDYSNTAPSAPTSFTKVSDGVRQATGTGADGTTTAYATFSAVIPSVNASEIRFGYKTYNVVEPYTYVSGSLDSGSTWKGKIEGLVPGMAYDFVAVARNVYGKQSPPASLTNQAAASDTTAPGTPSGLAATAKIDGVELAWTLGTEIDLAGYEIYRGLSTDPTSLLCEVGKQNKFVDRSGSIGTTYYYRIKAKDYSKNVSAYSASVSAAPGQVTETAIGTGAVTGGKIGSGAVDPSKRSDVTSDNYFSSIGAGSVIYHSFSHSLGKVPVVTVHAGNNSPTQPIIVWVSNVTSSTIVVGAYNASAIASGVTWYVNYW